MNIIKLQGTNAVFCDENPLKQLTILIRQKLRIVIYSGNFQYNFYK